MRLEWLPWIRQRNWQAFDDLARSEPSWLLFETVRELALGYPNDDDRDRLRLVLRTLSEQGYADEQSKSVESPAPVAQRPESYYLPCSPYQLASMTPPAAPPITCSIKRTVSLSTSLPWGVMASFPIFVSTSAGRR